MMNERRKAIIEILNLRRDVKIENLAFELRVSRRTIERDILFLSADYPIYTTKGTYGGVHVVEGAQLNLPSRFNTDEIKLLQKLKKRLTGKDAETMKKILMKLGVVH